MVASAGKSASDDSTDGSSAHDDYARAHGSTSEIQLGQAQDIGSAQFRQSKWFST